MKPILSKTKAVIDQRPPKKSETSEPAAGRRSSSTAAAGRFLTVKQLAARWQISVRQVHRIIATGALRVHHFGRSIRIAIEDIELFEFRNRGHREAPPDMP